MPNKFMTAPPTNTFHKTLLPSVGDDLLRRFTAMIVRRILLPHSLETGRRQEYWNPHPSLPTQESGSDVQNSKLAGNTSAFC